MKKISELTSATSLTTSDVFPVVQSGTTKKTTLNFTQAGTGAVSRTLQSKNSDTVSAKDFGVVADGSTDDTTALQAAITYLTGNGGGKLVLPSGFIKTTSVLNITSGIVIEGAGIGVGVGVGNSGGTVIRSSSAAGHVFYIASDESVILRDFTIDAPSVTKAANTAGVYLAGTSGYGDLNNRTRLENLRISNMWYGIVFDAAMNCVIHGCHIQDYLQVGILIDNYGGTDSGHNTIDSCVIWDLNVGTSQANIQYNQGGDLRIVNNKLLGGSYGFRVALADGETGTVLITGNSFEEHLLYDLWVAQAAVGKNFGNLVVVGNQFSTLTPPTPGPNIYISTGTPGGGATCWIKLISIVGNVFNNAHNASQYAISVQDGEGVTVAANAISCGNQTNPGGIDVGGNVVSAKVSGNKVFDVAAGKAYSTSTFKWKTPNAMLLFSTGGATVAAGSTVYLGTADANATETLVSFYVPFKCALLNMETRADAAPGVGQTYTYTLRVGAVDQALTSTTSNPNSDGYDRTHVVLVEPPSLGGTGSRVSLKLVTSGGAAVTSHSVSVQVTETD